MSFLWNWYKQQSKVFKALFILEILVTSGLFYGAVSLTIKSTRESKELESKLETMQDFESFYGFKPEAGNLLVAFGFPRPVQELHILARDLNLSQVYFINISESNSWQVIIWQSTKEHEIFTYFLLNSYIRIELWTSMNWQLSCLGRIDGNFADGILLSSLDIYFGE